MVVVVVVFVVVVAVVVLVVVVAVVLVVLVVLVEVEVVNGTSFFRWRLQHVRQQHTQVCSIWPLHQLSVRRMCGRRWVVEGGAGGAGAAHSLTHE